jgi:hypothetical protein
MQINVVKDPTGKIIATYENAAQNSGQVVPVLPAGHKVEALQVSDNYRANLSALYATGKA